ncbi:AsmA family protein [Variovorax rhizosphaerae]|uniref:AsmA family protein n=1 Tax=Variovorax rhizosphaerae TaxID=1836200 RepID=A0ABU8WY80_9BURK
MLSSPGAAPAAQTRGPARRFLRIAGILLAVLGLLVVGALVASRQAFPPARLAALLAEHASTATGRALRIDGELKFRLWPTLAVEARDISLANADWASAPQMVHADQVAFELSLQDLLHRELRILSIEVKGLDLDLESDGKGRFNWQLPHQQAAASPKGGSSLQALDHVTVTDARVRYPAGKGGKGGTGGDMRQLDIDSFSLAVQSDGNALNATVTLGKQPWKIEGRTGPLAKLLGGADEWPLALNFSTEGASLSAQGALGDGASANTFNGKVALRVTSGAVLPYFASAAAALPMPLEVDATMSLTPKVVHAESMTLSMAGQQFTGGVDVQTEPLRVQADLAATTLDLARLYAHAAPASAPSTSAKTPKPLFGDAPLRFEDLPSIDAEIALKIDRLDVPGLPPIAALNARLTNTNGLLDVGRLDFTFADGPVRTRLKVAQRAGAAPRVEAQVEARSLSVDVLDAMGPGNVKHFVGGRANLDLQLVMVGQTPAKLAASATGNALFTVSGVALAGKSSALDQNIVARVLEALLPKSVSHRDLTIQCIVARLPLRNGVAAIDHSIAMETSQIAVSANGEVNLVRQTIGLAFQPRAKKGLDLKAANLVQLLLLAGPLQAPELSINPLGAAKQAADLGIAAATGGWSLLAPAIRARRGESVCDFAASGSTSGKGDAASGKDQRQPFRPIRNLLGR